MARGRGHRPHRSPGACALAAVERRPAGGRRAGRGLGVVTPDARGAGPDGRLDLRHRRGAARGDRIRRRAGHDRDRRKRHDRWGVRDPRRRSACGATPHGTASCISTSSTTSRTSTCGSPATSPIRCWVRVERRRPTARRRALRRSRSSELDAHLERFADQLAAGVGRDERETPGAGAAGGVGFALLSIQDRFRSFALRPGVDLVMELTDFEEKLGAGGHRDHRRRSHRRPDRVRQDRARRGAAGSGGRRGLRGGRRRGRAGRDRRAGQAGRGGGAGRRAAAVRRGGDGGRDGTARTMWGADRSVWCRCGDPGRDAQPAAEGETAEEAALLEPCRVVRQAARALPARARAVRARRARVDLRPPGLGAPPGPDERADPDDPHPEQRGRERRGRVRGAADGVSVGAAGAAARPRGGLGRGRAVRRARRRTGNGSSSRHSPS